MHVHRNLPGVLAKINGVLADCGVNIDGQSLGTRGEVGYVVTDVGKALDEPGVAALAGLPETIRLRALHRD
ncbi:MAG: hypothetical protein ACR2F6_12195 [Mycobacteriales bacterium]